MVSSEVLKGHRLVTYFIKPPVMESMDRKIGLERATSSPILRLQVIQESQVGSRCLNFDMVVGKGDSFDDDKTALHSGAWFLLFRDWFLVI